jgi:hypothetical protein
MRISLTYAAKINHRKYEGGWCIQLKTKSIIAEKPAIIKIEISTGDLGVDATVNEIWSSKQPALARPMR